MPESKLFCGNLSYKCTEQDLTESFENAGFPVKSANVIKDRDTQKSKGFGFVELQSASDVEAAIAQMHNTDLAGRTITVNRAKPMVRTGGGGRRY